MHSHERKLTDFFMKIGVDDKIKPSILRYDDSAQGKYLIADILPYVIESGYDIPDDVNYVFKEVLNRDEEYFVLLKIALVNALAKNRLGIEA